MARTRKLGEVYVDTGTVRAFDAEVVPSMIVEVMSGVGDETYGVYKAGDVVTVDFFSFDDPLLSDHRPPTLDWSTLGTMNVASGRLVVCDPCRVWDKDEGARVEARVTPGIYRAEAGVCLAHAWDFLVGRTFALRLSLESRPLLAPDNRSRSL